MFNLRLHVLLAPNLLAGLFNLFNLIFDVGEDTGIDPSPDRVIDDSRFCASIMTAAFVKK